METFTLRNLNFSYPGQSQKALTNINMSVGEGKFILLTGASGCGKTTLLRQLKPGLSPHGSRSGIIRFEGKSLSELSLRAQSQKIGFVRQNPDNQLVTDKVWHELAFGLESLGCDNQTIRLRVAEMAAFFAMESWFYQDVAELSGGQKQLLNLASIMTMHPTVLILDEPTAQLDPIAASDFLATLAKINQELSVTIILSEHRLEEVFPLADRVVVLDRGQILYNGPPEKMGEQLRRRQTLYAALPTPMRIWAMVDNDLPCPITVREGRQWLDQFSASHALDHDTFANNDMGVSAIADMSEPVLSVDEVWFRYEKNTPDVIKGLSLHIRRGEFLTVMGGNGAGKSTLLSLFCGSLTPCRGSIKINGTLAALPQNPQALLVKKTLKADLAEMFAGSGLAKKERTWRINRVVRLCRLSDLLDRHPYDLSQGEQQRAALAKVLLTGPDILLLDEPTKGLDAEFKATFAAILRRLQLTGITIVMVSHDIEFSARYAQRCAMLFNGRISGAESSRDFFSGNTFYTTAANRMSRHLLPRAVIAEDIVAACGGNLVNLAELPELPEDDPRDYVLVTDKDYSNSPAAFKTTEDDLPRQKQNPSFGQNSAKEGLSRRTKAAAVMILLAIPLTIYFGIYYLDDRKYLLISLLILVEAMIPFALVFESRKPQARELIIIAVLCAIAVAARAVFMMIPEFKPVAALVIITAVAFGGETGFLVGAMSMLISNMMLSQGPWTPWQMFAMGSIGFLAGILFRKGRLKKNKTLLCIFGGLATLLIYGGIMNPAAVLIFQNAPTWQMIAAAYIAGFPFDLIHAAATVIFLLLLSRPMLEKLDRIKIKYGLIK